MAEEPTDEQMHRIKDALAARRKIEAIKIYREATGQGLTEAKAFIDALVPKLKEKDPKKYAALSASQGSGCASLIVACFIPVAGVIVWVVKTIS